MWDSVGKWVRYKKKNLMMWQVVMKNWLNAIKKKTCRTQQLERRDLWMEVGPIHRGVDYQLGTCYASHATLGFSLFVRRSHLNNHLRQLRCSSGSDHVCRASGCVTQLRCVLWLTVLTLMSRCESKWGVAHLHALTRFKPLKEDGKKRETVA